MNKQRSHEGLSFSKIKPEEYQLITDLINEAYSVEIGCEGVSFKTSQRVAGGEAGGQSMEDLREKLQVVRLSGEVVGAVGVTYNDKTGVADIGPLAISVCRQREGLGGRIVEALEGQYDITEVGVVSCRTDVLPWYHRNGYTTFQQIPLEKALPHEVEFLTRTGLMFVLKQKINRVSPAHVQVRPLSGEDSLDTVLELVNEAYKIEIGNTGLAFKELDRLRDISDIAREETHVALLGMEIVGVVGIKLTEDKAALGPLAVRRRLQGQGVGGALLDYAESLRGRTEVGIVSCRTDLLDYYGRRGYRFINEVPAEKTNIDEFEKLTRAGITLKYFEKSTF